MPKTNSVLEVYKGIQIRKSNHVFLRVGAPLYKFLILESERTGIPISKILVYSDKPCEVCAKSDIIVYNKDNDQFTIKRGILARHHPENQGRSIIHHAKEKKTKNDKSSNACTENI